MPKAYKMAGSDQPYRFTNTNYKMMKKREEKKREEKRREYLFFLVGVAGKGT